MIAVIWQQTPDRRTWRASARGLLLTVSKTAGGEWAPIVEGPGVTERPLSHFGTRLAAQAWCANRAGATREH